MALDPPLEAELRFRDGSVRSLKLVEAGGRMLKFEGYDVPETARALGNSELWIERQAAPSLPQGEHYVADLEGKQVLDAKRGLLGKVAAVIETGRNHCLEIQPEKGESYLIPMTDDVILGIGDQIQVRLLPGLHPDETEEA